MDTFMSKIIAVANQKGGVGKSTICLNIGGVLAEKGKKTLLIDMDPQAILSSNFIENIHSYDPTMYNLLLNGDIHIKEIVKDTHIDNLFILPSNLSLIDLDAQLAGDFDSQYRLSENLDQLPPNQFDYIIIDCPPNLGAATRMALVAAQDVLIPIECEDWAVKASRQILGYIERVKKRPNPDLSLSGFIINRFKKQRNIQKSFLESLRETYKEKVFKTQIGDYVQYAEANTQSKPINFYSPKSEQAEAFKKLTREIFHV